MQKATLSVVAAIALVAGVACGGSNDSGTPTSPSPSPSGPGTITVSASAISNQNGKILVVLATPEAAATTPVGRLCVPISANAFTLAGTTMVDVAASNNPCDAANVTKTFPAGRYAVSAGVFVAGSQTPEKITTQTVQVAGNVTVSISGAALSQ